MIFTGKNVEEAIQNGLRELDIPRMKAHITVIAREKNGFLGFGKKPAQVEIDVISESTVNKADKKAVRGVPAHIKEKNEPVKTTSQETVELGQIVSAVKKVEVKGQPVEPEVKAEILKNKKPARKVLEETGQDQVLEELTTQTTVPETSSLDSLGIEVGRTYDIHEVVREVTAYVQTIVDDMDVDATIESSHNRRTINMQVETNEPGRVIGYHGKVLKSIQFLAQNFLYNRFERNFYITINVNDYQEHRAEVLQGYAQKIASKVLEDQSAYQTDPMSNNERKVMHRIIAKIDGVTSYSEGSEPNRYVVIDLER